MSGAPNFTKVEVDDEDEDEEVEGDEGGADGESKMVCHLPGAEGAPCQEHACFLFSVVPDPSPDAKPDAGLATCLDVEVRRAQAVHHIEAARTHSLVRRLLPLLDEKVPGLAELLKDIG